MYKKIVNSYMNFSILFQFTFYVRPNIGHSRKYSPRAQNINKKRVRKIHCSLQFTINSVRVDAHLIQ